MIPLNSTPIYSILFKKNWNMNFFKIQIVFTPSVQQFVSADGKLMQGFAAL